MRAPKAQNTGQQPDPVLTSNPSLCARVPSSFDDSNEMCGGSRQMGVVDGT